GPVSRAAVVDPPYLAVGVGVSPGGHPLTAVTADENLLEVVRGVPGGVTGPLSLGRRLLAGQLPGLPVHEGFVRVLLEQTLGDVPGRQPAVRPLAGIDDQSLGVERVKFAALELAEEGVADVDGVRKDVSHVRMRERPAVEE